MSAIILIAFLAATFWLSYKKPAVALGLVLALTPAYLIRFRIIIPTTLLELAIVVFLLALLCSNWQRFNELKKLGRINWAIGLFMAAGVVSVLVSPEKSKALGQLKAFIVEPVLLFYAALLVFKDKANIKTALSWVFASATLVSIFGIFQYATLFRLPFRFWGNGEEVRRITSVFEYPNALALFLAPLFVMFVVLAVKKYSLGPKAWIIFGLSMQAVALIFTFSRGAWLAVAGVLFLTLLKALPPKKVVPAVVLVMVLVLMLPAARQRIMVTFNDPSGVARVDLMNAGIDKLKHNPIFGNGLYGFRNTLESQSFPGEILNYPHNIVLNFWLELGILGLAAFVWILYLAFIRSNKTAASIAAICFLCVVIIHGLIDAPYFKNDLAVLFWMAIAVIYSE